MLISGFLDMCHYELDRLNVKATVALDLLRTSMNNAVAIADSQKKELLFNPNHITINDENIMRGILLHEIAHLMIDYEPFEDAHSYRWRMKCFELGGIITLSDPRVKEFKHPTEENIMSKLYHSDIYVPPELTLPQKVVKVRYGKHATQAAFNDKYRTVPLPWRLDLGECRLVEVEISNKIKYVVRKNIDPNYDAIYVLIKGGIFFCKTVWVNKISDNHATLDRSRYESV